LRINLKEQVNFYADRMNAVKEMYDLTPGNAVGINDGPVALHNLR
jgi:hypothetical protein